MYPLIFSVIIFFLFFFNFVFAELNIDESERQYLFRPESRWDKEWKSGTWGYLDKITVERSRLSIIGGVFIQMLAPENASVVDVGCGEGPLSDFLNVNQKSNYVGVDLSKVAISNARIKRPSIKFIHSPANLFNPENKFDVVVFSDVLYYTEYEKVIAQYLNFLNPKGIMIISIFHQTDKLKYEEIFKHAREVMEYVDEIELSGYTKKPEEFSESKNNRERSASHIEVYRKK